MTQEEQTALVDGQQAAAAAAAGDSAAPKKVDGEEPVKGAEEAGADATGKGSNGNQSGQESQAQMRALFKQIIRMRSVRKLSPAAKAAKAARQAARAAANAAKAAEVAAKAADCAAKAAQDAAQAAFDENAKAEADKKPAPPVEDAEAVKSETTETNKPEEVAAK